MSKVHSFHIPVMGIGFTIDTPLKVAHLGIDSVISLVDDILIEKMRRMYCEMHQLKFTEITAKHDDYRAKRITAYLNMLNALVNEKFENLLNATQSKADEIKKYFNLLPNELSLKKEYQKLMSDGVNFEDIKAWIKGKLHLGSIDVNIMTKVDKDNYKNKEKLPVEYNDAHAALRGFAQSDLQSSLVLSAGMNPRLFSYMEQFDDFYPNSEGEMKKKIILKVSDYRSAFIQGKILAKKGLWVSEYRIESGLNCGGHAFATNGYLMGPILEEFRAKRETLKEELLEVLNTTLANKGKEVPKDLSIKISAQGGVGTSEEHNFLLDHYKVDSVGWGTPLLLVPEAVNIDALSLEKMTVAKEDDLYLSDISPLGVPFNSVKGNSKDAEKESKIDKGRPGSSCPKKFIALNKEFSEEGMCTASRQYQHLKINELNSLELTQIEHKKQLEAITVKSCTCVGLGTSALLVNNLSTKVEGPGVSVCPGPNMAYFSKKMSLQEAVSHIYGKVNVIERTDRPNMFVKELNIYLDYLNKKVDDTVDGLNRKQEKFFKTFISNLNDGIRYYQEMVSETIEYLNTMSLNDIQEIENGKYRLEFLKVEVERKTQALLI